MSAQIAILGGPSGGTDAIPSGIGDSEKCRTGRAVTMTGAEDPTTIIIGPAQIDEQQACPIPQ